MAAISSGLYDPLKKVVPPNPVQVPNIGGIAVQPPQTPNPVANPTVRTATPGPSPGGISIPLPPNAQTMVGKVQGAIAAPPPPAAAPAPAPAPAAAAPGSSSSSSTSYTYGSQGGVSPGTSSTLEDQLRNIITGFASGATSKAFIDRAKNQLGSAVEGQRNVAVNRANEDLIRRGLYKSGLGAEQAQAIGTGAQGALSSGIADILSKAEQQDIAAKESAGGMAGNLLAANRQWDMYEQQRADEQAARAAANRQEDTTFAYQDPETGQVYQLDSKWFQ